MMIKNLSNLSPNPGSHRTRKRLGRGIGSGLGKTSGKGHKGQLARKSSDVGAGFEGGQTPLYRRIPKFGFTNKRTKVVFNIIYTSQLNQFADGSIISNDILAKEGFLRYKGCPVKILVGASELKKKLQINVDKVSSGAKDVIEKAGGKIQGKE
jgi:large subunit ribosomal protein L15